jgi:hypothetical protein
MLLLDPGSRIQDTDPGWIKIRIWDKNPGFTTLPECLNRIQIPIFPYRTTGQKEHGSGIWITSKNLNIHNPNHGFSALGNMIQDVYSGSRICIIFHPGSRSRSKKGKKSTESWIRNTCDD